MHYEIMKCEVNLKASEPVLTAVLHGGDLSLRKSRTAEDRFSPSSLQKLKTDDNYG